ncbi:MRG-domain-containing protein [Mollisia scopiformis]|uniref:Chromatin modification-related protein EAF3 n=1 Tax=Mollisia scopiformis TaxID=149040 RepID=A0A194XEP5_MOLSC|nr:MRG-domain-containing protein [Mollisia scopiformis]KUJ18227.1 MRG-domain-containing protein [Mollisia scopiformis]
MKLRSIIKEKHRIEKVSNHVTNSWDDWVPQDRVRKFTDENKELAAQLHNQMKMLQQKPAKSMSKKGGRTNGSDFSSARGSEERHASAAAQGGRGPRRTRDYDLENTSNMDHTSAPKAISNADHDSDTASDTASYTTEEEDWGAIGAEGLLRRAQGHLDTRPLSIAHPIKTQSLVEEDNEHRISSNICPPNTPSDTTEVEDWGAIGTEGLIKRAEGRGYTRPSSNANLPKTQAQVEQGLHNFWDDESKISSSICASPSSISSSSNDPSSTSPSHTAVPSSAPVAPSSLPSTSNQDASGLDHSHNEHSSPISHPLPSLRERLNRHSSPKGHSLPGLRERVNEHSSPIGHSPHLHTIMDPDSESELSDVDESIIDQYESETRATDLQAKRELIEEEESVARPSKISQAKDAATDAAQSSRNSLRSDGQVALPAASTSRRGKAVLNLNPHADENHSGYLKVTRKNHWSNPGTDLYDIKRMLMSDQCLAPDTLLQRPTPDFKYIQDDGTLRPAPHYDWNAKNKEKDKKKYTGHPKYAAHKRNNTATRENLLYYNFMQKDHNIPLAGMLDIKQSQTSEVRDLAAMVMRVRTYDLTDAQPQEEAFNTRPSIHLPIPDHIKAILVDDWENVTKNQQLVPLPAPHSVESILNDYLAFENPKRQAGTHQADLLLEVIQGLKEYFEKCLGRILLYRFERQQYFEVREGWNMADGELAGKTAITTYGAEHFCRLLVSLPELLAQTNMDQQSCNRLCEELAKLTIWLGRNAFTYFRSEYETPGPSYIEKARNS